MLEEPVDRRDGHVGLACAGRHLHEGSRAIILERLLEPFDRDHLAISESGWIQDRQGPDACAKGRGPGNKLAHRIGPEEAEYFAGAGIWVAGVCEARDDTRALIDERERLVAADPFELGGRVPTGLLLDGRELLAPSPRASLR